MTDRYHSLTVVLDKDYRSDDARKIIAAIKMVKGVIAVDGAVTDPSDFMARKRAVASLGDKIIDLIYSEGK